MFLLVVIVIVIGIYVEPITHHLSLIVYNYQLRVHYGFIPRENIKKIAMLLLCDSIQIHLPLYSLTVGVFADILQK